MLPFSKWMVQDGGRESKRESWVEPDSIPGYRLPWVQTMASKACLIWKRCVR
jgi:hypothetical protein